jgi:hypothetical protein
MQEKENKFSLIKERIIYFVENQSIKKKDFFYKVGITSANFRGNAVNTPLNSNTFENIFALYPEINLEWLITGKGNMLKSDVLNNQNNIENIDNDPKYKDQSNQSLLQEIENLKNTISLLESERDFLREIIKIPPLEKSNSA